MRQDRDDQNRRVPLPPRVREEGHQKLEREVNNMPTWMAKRGKTTTFQLNKPTKPPVFLFSAVCFNTAQSNRADQCRLILTMAYLLLLYDLP